MSNHTATHSPSVIHTCFHHITKQYPDQIALIDQETTLTYLQVDKLSNQIASALLQFKVKKGDKVAFCLERTYQLYPLMLAILKVGATMVPLNHDQPTEFLREILTTVQPALLITNIEQLTTSIQGRFVTEDRLFTLAEQQNEHPLTVSCHDNDPALLLFTSGSTGQPKGVLIAHRGLARLAQPSPELQLNLDDRFLQIADVSFAASTIDIWMSLLNGATLVIAPSTLPNLNVLTDLITTYRVTTLFLSGGLFRLLLETAPDSLCQVRRIVTSGDFVNPRLFKLALEKLPGVKIFNAFGCTENSSLSALYEVTMQSIGYDENPLPIGKPVPRVTMQVLKSDLHPCTANEVGELYIGGDGLALGYFTNPEATAQGFITHPVTQQRLYGTKDLAYIDTLGNITLLGREDHICKIRGYRVDITGIEHILRSHPAIEDATVILEPTEYESRLVAFYTSNIATLSAGELRTFLTEKLPHYMIPEIFTYQTTLPTTRNGKRDRHIVASSTSQQQKTPQTHPLEGVVLNIWREILNNPHANDTEYFLDQGGNSLHFIKLAAMLEKIFALPITPEDIFRASTVKEVAQLITQKQAHH